MRELEYWKVANREEENATELINSRPCEARTALLKFECTP